MIPRSGPDPDRRPQSATGSRSTREHHIVPKRRARPQHRDVLLAQLTGCPPAGRDRQRASRVLAASDPGTPCFVNSRIWHGARQRRLTPFGEPSESHALIGIFRKNPERDLPGVHHCYRKRLKHLHHQAHPKFLLGGGFGCPAGDLLWG